MQTDSIFIVQPTEDQERALKAFVKALKIKYTVTKEGKYNRDFVAKIKKSQKEFDQGNFTRVKKEDLKKYLGIPL